MADQEKKEFPKSLPKQPAAKKDGMIRHDDFSKSPNRPTPRENPQPITKGFVPMKKNK